MSCCPSNIVPFFDVATSVIPYAGQFGPEPKVSLYYRDPDTGQWYTVNAFMGTSVHFDPVLSEILIDHGGILTGFVKIQ